MSSDRVDTLDVHNIAHIVINWWSRNMDWPHSLLSLVVALPPLVVSHRKYSSSFKLSAPLNPCRSRAMQKTQDRKRQREEDEEEEAEKGPAFSVNPDSLGKAAPSRLTLPSFENIWSTRSVSLFQHTYPSIALILSSALLLCCYLGAGMKTGKTSKIDRITHILEGRKDSKFEHDGHAGGLTNKEKLRKKNFVMVRKGKKSVNNKSRKAAGLDRHEKNTAASLSLSVSALRCLTDIFSLHSTPTAPAVLLSVPHTIRMLQLLICTVFDLFSLFRRSNLAETRGRGGEHRQESRVLLDLLA